MVKLQSNTKTSLSSESKNNGFRDIPYRIKQKVQSLYNKGMKGEARKFLRDKMNVGERHAYTLLSRCLDKPQSAYTMKNRGETATMTITSDKNDLESVVAQCNVDMKQWEVRSFNVREVKDNRFLWHIYFKQRPFEFDIKDIADEIKKVAPIIKKIKYPKQKDGFLAEVNIPDLHLAKLAWAEEIGHNYDIEIAKNIFRDAIDQTISAMAKYPIDRIVFPIGNDFFHFDNFQNTTTAGTSQDTDTRYLKMYREGCALIIEAINKLQCVAPVDCIVVAGNHGRISELLMGELLTVYYDKNPNVSINNQPVPRKYYRYGNTLIGFTHGDEIKMAELPLIMAAETPEMWGATKYRFYKMGHLHHQKFMINENSGVICEVVPSLSGVDYWHKKRAFSNNIRSCATSLYSKDNGCLHKIFYNL